MSYPSPSSPFAFVFSELDLCPNLSDIEQKAAWIISSFSTVLLIYIGQQDIRLPGMNSRTTIRKGLGYGDSPELHKDLILTTI